MAPELRPGGDDLSVHPALRNPPVQPPQRRQRRPRRGGRRLRRARLLMVAALGVLVISGIGLVYLGTDRVWNSTAGSFNPGLAPDEAGYRARVTPTPTLLLASIDADGGLAGLAVLALNTGDDGGGSVIVLPVGTTSVPAPSSSVETGREETLHEAYVNRGEEGLHRAVETLLNATMDSMVVADDASWEALLDSVSPLSMTIPDPVGEGWSAGDVEVNADEAGEFLSTLVEGESEVNRVLRQEIFWRTWVDAVAVGGAEAVPGEAGTGLGGFVDSLAGGPLSVLTPSVSPVDGVDEPDGGVQRLAVEADELAAMVSTEIPFPQEPRAGARVRIELLNGTSDAGLLLEASTPLVEAGGQIAITGNANSFGVQDTQILYAEERAREEAELVRDALGVGSIELREGAAPVVPEEDEGERIDVTVVLGADAPGAIRR